MYVTNHYYDGCNGEQTGQSFEGTLEECAEFLLELDTDDNGESMNDWDLESAKQALLEAELIKQPVYIDWDGDLQNWLTVN